MAETTYYVDTDVAGGAADGSSWANAYSSLNQAEQARDADITGGNAVVFLCRASAGTADTAAVTVGGWTTDADSYVLCKTDTTDRATCGWSTSKYRLSVSGAALTINEEFVRIDGLQIEQPTLSANVNMCGISAIGATNAIWLSACHLRVSAHATYYSTALSINDTDANVWVWNCVVASGSQVNAAGNGAISINNCATAYIYSCTLVGQKYGLRNLGAGAVVAKNTYAGGTLTADFNNAGVGSLVNTNCASEDLTADDFAGSGNATGVAVDTDTFVNVTFDGGEDLSLAADGNSPLVGAGVDTSGESAPLDFTIDILGTTRS